jgi:hypothetical protein
MAMNFPDDPEINDEFTVGNRTWVWTGVVWKAVTLNPLDLSVDGGTA